MANNTSKRGNLNGDNCGHKDERFSQNGNKSIRRQRELIASWLEKIGLGIIIRCIRYELLAIDSGKTFPNEPHDTDMLIYILISNATDNNGNIFVNGKKTIINLWHMWPSSFHEPGWYMGQNGWESCNYFVIMKQQGSVSGLGHEP